MPKFLIHGKTSSDFAAAMLNKPQDRYQVLLSFFEQFGIEVSEFVFTSGIDFNFVSVLTAPDDASVKAMAKMALTEGDLI